MWTILAPSILISFLSLWLIRNLSFRNNILRRPFIILIPISPDLFRKRNLSIFLRVVRRKSSSLYSRNLIRMVIKRSPRRSLLPICLFGEQLSYSYLLFTNLFIHYLLFTNLFIHYLLFTNLFIHYLLFITPLPNIFNYYFFNQS